MPRLVISDTSPIRYLILISQADLLPILYAEVLIPEAVAVELSQPASPEAVRQWMAQRPVWLQVVPKAAHAAPAAMTELDPGEHDAIPWLCT